MDSYDLAIKALKRGDFRAARDYFELEFKQAKKNKEMDKEYKACLNLGSAYGRTFVLSTIQTSAKFHDFAAVLYLR